MQGQSSSSFSPGQLGLQILRVHRHFYKMEYSPDNAIHTHQRDTAVEAKALSFCHIGDWMAGRRIWPERSDDCSRKACTFNKLHYKVPTLGIHLPMI